MKTNTIFRYPTALTIAGSDSGGGAGIQADIKTFSALGVYATSVITAVTAQNTQGLHGIQAISPEIVQSQIEAVLDDIPVDAIKIGMLYNQEIVEVVSQMIDKYKPAHVVLDPVMISTSGTQLLEDRTIESIIRLLFSRVTLITPNIDEAAFLSDRPIHSEEDRQAAGCQLVAMGCHSVLLKGGHLKGNEMTDYLFSTDDSPLRFSSPSVHTQNTHGTGCTLSSAITAYLAQGRPLPEAIREAKRYITVALQSGADVKIGDGKGPLNHFFAPIPLTKIESLK